ncbi:MAG: hypothetical protein ACRDHD_03795 [Candidatus Limnocylindria bacterium]
MPVAAVGIGHQDAGQRLEEGRGLIVGDVVQDRGDQVEQLVQPEGLGQDGEIRQLREAGTCPAQQLEVPGQTDPAADPRAALGAWP